MYVLTVKSTEMSSCISGVLQEHFRSTKKGISLKSDTNYFNKTTEFVVFLLFNVRLTVCKQQSRQINDSPKAEQIDYKMRKHSANIL